MDIKVTPDTWARILTLCHKMNDLVLEAGGRFYLAKDSTLRESDFVQSVGSKAVGRFLDLKKVTDPDGILTSSLAQRLGLGAR